MPLNKQGTLSCKNVVSLHERHRSSHNRGSVASQQVTKMFSYQKPQMIASRLMCTLLIYPTTLCVSIIFLMSLNDVTIVCFLLLVGKPCTCTGEPCQLTCAPTGIPPSCFSTATHGPSDQFRIPNFKPVTLSPRYFGAPSYQSLKFIKITC